MSSQPISEPDEGQAMSSGCCATCVHFQMASDWDRVLKDQARAELAREAGFTSYPDMSALLGIRFKTMAMPSAS